MVLRTLPNVVVGSGGAGQAERLTVADQARLRRYQEYLDWYSGKQWSKERRGRSNLVVNYCRAMVDKGVSYLLGGRMGFSVEAGEELSEEGAAEAERLVYRVYEESELESVEIQAATNGAVLGDTVFKVFWEGARGNRGTGRRSDGGRIRVVNQDPMRFFCEWAEDDLGTMVKAHAVYPLTVAEAGRRFGGTPPPGPLPRGETPPPGPLPRGERGGILGPSLALGERGRLVGVVETWTEATLEVWVGDERVLEQANPYGFIPFVHIPNARPANEFWGVSDLKDLMPLNRELNERFSDMADTIRFHADPPVVFRGVSEHTEMAVGPGTVWDVPEGADVFLLEWRGQQPAAFEHVDRVMRALHDVAEMPKTAFGETGRIQSGVALQVEMQSVVQKTMRKRALWGAGLQRRNAMVLRIGEMMGLGSFAPYRSRVIWPALLPSDAEAEVASNVKLVEAGLRSRRTAMDRLGAESPEDEMERIEGERSVMSDE